MPKVPKKFLGFHDLFGPQDFLDSQDFLGSFLVAAGAQSSHDGRFRLELGPELVLRKVLPTPRVILNVGKQRRQFTCMGAKRTACVILRHSFSFLVPQTHFARCVLKRINSYFPSSLPTPRSTEVLREHISHNAARSISLNNTMKVTHTCPIAHQSGTCAINLNLSHLSFGALMCFSEISLLQMFFFSGVDVFSRLAYTSFQGVT